MKHFLISGLALSLISTGAFAKPSVNDMSACQATVNFVIDKLETIPGDKYPEADRRLLQDTLTDYSDYIQSEHITPGLMEFNDGDADKAKAMQKQVSNYQKTLIAAMEQKYTGNRLYTDQAVMIDGCYSKAPMSEAMTETMTTALTGMVQMAMMK